MWVRRTATPPPHRFHYHTQSQLDPTRSTPRHFPECPRARGRRRRRARKGPILPPIAPGYGFGTKCPTRSGRRNPGGPAPLRRPPLLTYRLQLVPLRRTPTGASRPSPLPPLNRQRKEKAASMPSWIKLSSRNNGHRPESKAGFTCGQFDGNLERLTPVKRMLPTESSAPDPRYPPVLHRGIPVATFGPTAWLWGAVLPALPRGLAGPP